MEKLVTLNLKMNSAVKTDETLTKIGFDLSEEMR